MKTKIKLTGQTFTASVPIEELTADFFAGYKFKEGSNTIILDDTVATIEGLVKGGVASFGLSDVIHLLKFRDYSGYAIKQIYDAYTSALIKHKRVLPMTSLIYDEILLVPQ